MSLEIDIDFIPTCVAIYKKEADDFIVIDFNKKSEEVESIFKKEILGCKLTNIFPNVKDNGLFDALLRVEHTGKTETFETKIYKENRISVYRKNEVIKLPNGNILTYFTNITDEKNLNAILIEQQNTFHKVMKDSDAISIQGYDENHEVVYWNRASEKVYGYSEKEVIGKKLEDLIIPESMKGHVYDAVEKWMIDGVEIPAGNITLKDKDYNDVYVYSQHKMIQVSLDKTVMYCIDIDLSCTKQLENELLAQRNFLKTIFDTIPDLIWAKNIDGTYLTCNTKFENFFGAKEDEIVGKTDSDFVDKELAEFFIRNDKIALDRGVATINEEYLVFADESYKGDFETIKTPIRDRENKITGILGIARDISLRKNYERQLLSFVNTDNLTGLSNRAVLMDRLEQVLKQRNFKDREYAILFIDLDDFKKINDTKGHHIGDELLIEVSKRLRGTVRKGDTVSRFGGDEFILLLENINNKSAASNIAKKVLKVLQEPVYIGKYILNISASIGISICPADGEKAEVLLCNADDAMYYAKKYGKNGYKFYTEIIK